MKRYGLFLPFFLMTVFAFQQEPQVRHVLVNRGELATFQTITHGFTNFIIYTRNCRYVASECYDPNQCPAVAMIEQDPLEVSPGAVLELNLYLNPNDPAFRVADGFEITRFWFAGVQDSNGDPGAPNGVDPAIIETLIEPGVQAQHPYLLSFSLDPNKPHYTMQIDVSWLSNTPMERWLAYIDITYFIEEYDQVDPNDPTNPNKMSGFFFNETTNRYESVLRVVFDPEACHGDCTI